MSTIIMQFFWAMCNTFLESKSYTRKNAQVVTSLQISCHKNVVKVSSRCQQVVIDCLSQVCCNNSGLEICSIMWISDCRFQNLQYPVDIRCRF